MTMLASGGTRAWNITPNYRANHGVEDAWQEAVDQLRQVYDEQLTRPWAPTTTLTLSLTRYSTVLVNQDGSNVLKDAW